jgi:hypothetical protein
MLIDHIRTDTFSIGCFGRSGSRTIADFLSGYYSDYQMTSGKFRFLFDVDNLPDEELDVVKKRFNDDKHLQKMLESKFMSHHEYTVDTIDTFNNAEPIKILVLRDPIERANSGANLAFDAELHGAPVLHEVDFDSVDYIIDFNKLSEYSASMHLGGYRKDREFTYDHLDNLRKQELSVSDPNWEVPWRKWKIEDYSYDEDIELYTNAMKTKPELPLDVWKSLVRNYNTINLPTRMFGKKYKA